MPFFYMRLYSIPRNIGLLQNCPMKADYGSELPALPQQTAAGLFDVILRENSLDNGDA